MLSPPAGTVQDIGILSYDFVFGITAEICENLILRLLSLVCRIYGG